VRGLAAERQENAARAEYGPLGLTRDLGAKFATRRRNEIREKSPIGGRPKLTVLSDASLEIFLRPRAPSSARYASMRVCERSPLMEFLINATPAMMMRARLSKIYSSFYSRFSTIAHRLYL